MDDANLFNWCVSTIDCIQRCQQASVCSENINIVSALKQYLKQHYISYKVEFTVTTITTEKYRRIQGFHCRFYLGLESACVTSYFCASLMNNYLKVLFDQSAVNDCDSYREGKSIFHHQHCILILTPEDSWFSLKTDESVPFSHSVPPPLHLPVHHSNVIFWCCSLFFARSNFKSN